MGGRGSAYNFNGDQRRGGGGGSLPLDELAVGNLNQGVSKGTNKDKAINRFREKMMNQTNEFSAYYDADGYIHALGTSNNSNSTRVQPFSNVSKEKRVIGTIHNHPYQNWLNGGGPFSKEDLFALRSDHRFSGGRIKEIVATSKEGTYKATIKKKAPSREAIKKAYNKAMNKTKGDYSSKKKMRETLTNNIQEEMGKIGIEVTFNKGTRSSSNLKTQKLKKSN